MKPFIVYVDFDGVITDSDHPENGIRVRSGTKEFLEAVKALGGQIHVYSTRANYQQIKAIHDHFGVDCWDEMLDVMRGAGIDFHLVMTSQGASPFIKPYYDFIIEDKSVPSFTGNWNEALEYIKTRVNDPTFVSVLEKFSFV